MKLIMRHNPSVFRPVDAFRRDIGRLFDFSFPSFPDLADLYREFASTSEFGAVDLYRDGNKFVVRAELPGVNRQDIGVDVVNGNLVLSVSTAKEAPTSSTAETTVETEQPAEAAESKDVVKQPEASASENAETESSCKCDARFSRSFRLPENVDTDKISARYENGVLTVEIPQREEAKPRSIQVNVD